MHRLLFFIAICCWLPVGYTSAQVASTLPQKTYESFFLYQVKVIDEFIERFNNDSNSYLRTQCRTRFGTDTMLTRTRMLHALISKHRRWTDTSSILINQILTQNHQIHFTDSTWFARTTCRFLLHGRPVSIPIILYIHTYQHTYQWQIAAIGHINTTATPPTTTITPPSSTTPCFIPTSAHGTNWLQLHTTLTPQHICSHIFRSNIRNNPATLQFITLIRSGQLIFSQAQNTTYHFANIPGWLLTVANQPQAATNSGWLITNIQTANTDTDIPQYLATLP